MLNNEMQPRDVQADTFVEPWVVDLSKISSPALARILEEVRNDDPSSSRGYDRVHHRHNR